MPNQDDTIVLKQVYSATQADYSYSLISGIDNDRSHKQQLVFLHRYPTLGDGTAVADVEWTNWYDPYIIPESLVSLNSSIKTVVVGDTTTAVVTAANGTTYNMPAFAPGGDVSFEIRRSQDLDSKVVVFGAGSRITSTGLNSAVDQLFKSLQEIEDRTVTLESGETQGDVGATIPWTSVTDKPTEFPPSAHTHPISQVDGLQTELDDKLEDAPSDGTQYARQNGAWAAVQGGTGDVEEAPQDGTPYARQDAGWVSVPSGGDADLTQALESTETIGGITAGDTFASGDPIESVLRALLITYQAPGITSLNPLGSEVEVGASYSIGTVTFSITNRENANAAATMRFRRGSTSLNTQAITLTGVDGTAAQSHAFSPSATGTYTIPSGNTQQYSVRVEGTNTEAGSFNSTDTITAKYRSFAFASTSQTSSGAVSDIATGFSDLTTSTNVNLTVNGASSGGNYSWIAFPAVYFGGTPSISVTDTSTGFAATYNYIGDENYTNANGVVVSMSLFRSPFADSVGEGTVMDVS